MQLVELELGRLVNQVSTLSVERCEYFCLPGFYPTEAGGVLGHTAFTLVLLCVRVHIGLSEPEPRFANFA